MSAKIAPKSEKEEHLKEVKQEIQKEQKFDALESLNQIMQSSALKNSVNFISKTNRSTGSDLDPELEESKNLRSFDATLEEVADNFSIVEVPSKLSEARLDVITEIARDVYDFMQETDRIVNKERIAKENIERDQEAQEMHDLANDIIIRQLAEIHQEALKFIRNTRNKLKGLPLTQTEIDAIVDEISDSVEGYIRQRLKDVLTPKEMDEYIDMIADSSLAEQRQDPEIESE